MDITQKQADRIMRLVNGRNLTISVNVQQERAVRQYVRHLNRTLWKNDPIGETDADLATVIEGLIDTGLHTAMSRRDRWTDRFR